VCSSDLSNFGAGSKPVVVEGNYTANTKETVEEYYKVKTKETCLRIRKDPDKDSKVIDSLSRGEVIKVIKVIKSKVFYDADWGKVNHNGKTGYASMKYLEKQTVPATTSSAEAATTEEKTNEA
jgi:hypothetical protein